MKNYRITLYPLPLEEKGWTSPKPEVHYLQGTHDDAVNNPFVDALYHRYAQAGQPVVVTMDIEEVTR